MIYIYHCYRGAHMSVAAAALHLGLLTPDSIEADILSLAWFDKLKTDDAGVPIMAGSDSAGNQVYFMGLGPSGKIFTSFFCNLTQAMELAGLYRTVNCLVCIAPATRIGGFMTRWPLLRSLGRRLAAQGVRQRLAQLNTIVLQARAD